jgi:hypothetical protein
MIELKAQVFGVAVESPFVEARPFSKDWLDKIAIRTLNGFKNYGLKPENIVLRNTDVLFGYELSFPLFGGSATVALSATRFLLNFQNVTSRSAFGTVSETIVRAHALIEAAQFAEHMIRVIAHMPLFNQAEQIDKLMADPANQIEFGGKLVHVRIDDWAEAIRFEVDRSLLLQNALFLSWMTKFRGELNPDILSRAASAFENIPTRFGFSFQIPP